MLDHAHEYTRALTFEAFYQTVDGLGSLIRGMEDALDVVGLLVCRPTGVVVVVVVM